MAEENEGMEVQETEDRGDEFTPDEAEARDLGSDFDPELLEGIAGVEEVATDDGDDKGGEEGGDDKSDAGDDKGGKGDEHMIPKARLDEVLAKNQDLEARLAALEKGQQDDDADNEGEEGGDPEPSELEVLETNLEEKMKEASEALLDGDTELYHSLQKEVNKINREIAKKEWSTDQSQKDAEQSAQERMDQVAAAAYEKYPFLDVGSDSVDPDAVNVVISRRNQLIGEGVAAHEALQQAVDEKAPRFAKLNGIDPDAGKDGEETAEQKAAREERERKAREKSSDASMKQPGKPEGGQRETTFKVDVTKLSDTEFEKLPESAKARLRGDQV